MTSRTPRTLHAHVSQDVSGPLPPLLGAQLYAAVMGLGCLCATLFYDVWLRDQLPVDRSPGFALLRNLSFTALCGLAWIELRRQSDVARAARVSLAVHAACALLLAVPNPGEPRLEPGTPGISWLCVPILLFPLLVPLRPRRHVVLGLSLAALVPIGQLACGSADSAGWQQLAFPPALCALLAGLIAWVTHRTAETLQAARERIDELGSYQLERRLGEGGMGEVWLGQHRLLARPAAVKRIRPATLARAGDPEKALLRFEREARATASLRSNHTVGIYDYGRTHDGAFFYAMELLDGVDLERLVSERGPQPVGRVVSMLRQACLSLGEAHARGIVHRDVKPANLFLCRQGLELDVLKVLDFGLVLHLQASQGDPRITGEHRWVGTPACLAPELVEDTHAATPASDLYALGCVAYWLLTGRRVFEGASAMQVILAHVQEAPTPPSAYAPVPAEVEALVLACLRKDPAERPQDTEELSARLAECGVEAWSAQEARAWWAGFALEEGAPDPTAPTAG